MYGPPRFCNSPILGVAKPVCINVSGLFMEECLPGHDEDPRVVGSISWFGLVDRFRAELQRQGIDCAAINIELLQSVG